MLWFDICFSIVFPFFLMNFYLWHFLMNQRKKYFSFLMCHMLCIKNYIQMKRAGRTITYEILITEEDYKSEQAREFVAFWNNGSLKQFITAFYKDEPASKDEIEELRNAIEELEE